MATIAATHSCLADKLFRPAAAVEADVVEPEATTLADALLTTPPAKPKAMVNDCRHMDTTNVEQRNNSRKQCEEEENRILKRCSTDEQDAVAVASCLESHSPTLDESFQELEQSLNETTSQDTVGPADGTVLSTAHSSYIEISRISASSNDENLGSESVCSGWGGPSTLKTDEEPDSSTDAASLRAPNYEQRMTTAAVKNRTVTMDTDREADLLPTSKHTQRAQQGPREADQLTSSIQAVLQQRQNVLAQENREMQELLDLATRCADRESLAPKIHFLKEHLLAREQQHDAENKELAATVKALLSVSGREDEGEAGEFDLKQKERASADGQRSKGWEGADNDGGGGQVKSCKTSLNFSEEKQSTRPQQDSQIETLQAGSRTSTDDDRTSKPAPNTDPGQSTCPESETGTSPSLESKTLSSSPLPPQSCEKTDAAVSMNSTKTLKTSPPEEATISTAGRAEQKINSTKEAEQPRQQHLKQQRQTVEEDKDIVRQFRKNGSWWRQQVVNRLRLPGPNLSRKQFVSTFIHPDTAVDAALLNAVFDRMKVLLSTSEGVAEVVTVPHVLDLLEKTNGSNILNTLDAAELLEANIRCIERRMALQKTELQVFATRLMYRFFLAVSKKAFGELETLCKRVAPREATRTYAEQLENYRHLLIKSVAAEENISLDQSTVVVSKCIHNMRMELRNDLAMLQRGLPSDVQRGQKHQNTSEMENCRTQNLILEKPFAKAGARTYLTEVPPSPIAAAIPHKPSTTSSSYTAAAAHGAVQYPSAYPHNALQRVASPVVSPFAEYQTRHNPYVVAASQPPSSHAGKATGSSNLHPAMGIRCSSSDTSKKNLVASAAPNSTSSRQSQTKVAAVSSPLTTISRKNAEVPVKEKRPTCVVGTVGGTKTGEATIIKEILDEAGHSPVIRTSTEENNKKVDENSRGSTTKPPISGATTARVVSSFASLPEMSLNQPQASQKEKKMPNVVQTVEYRYADGTLVTNPAHLPEGARAIEAAARARLEETARVAQEAARRAEAAALAQFTAAAAAGGGNAAAACVAAAQYQKAFAALKSQDSSQERNKHEGTPVEKDSNNTTESQIQRVSSTTGATKEPVLHEEQQQHQFQQQEQTSQKIQQWKSQHLLTSTNVGGTLGPLPGGLVKAASSSTQASILRNASATAEDVAAQKGENTGARLQRVSSCRGRNTGENAFPPTNRAAVLKDFSATADYNAAVGIVPPGFPPGATGQLQALLQQQRLLTAVPGNMVTHSSGSSALPTPETTQISAPGFALIGGGTSCVPRGRAPRPLTSRTPEKEAFRRRSKGGCMGSPPLRKLNRHRNNSSRTPSVSSIQRAAGRFFASMGLWKSDGEDEEDEASEYFGDNTALPTPDGLAEATEKYMNGQQQMLQQKQQEYIPPVPQHFSLQQQYKQHQQLQQQQSMQHRLQQLQQHQLQQQQLQHQQMQQTQFQQQHFQQQQAQQQQLLQQQLLQQQQMQQQRMQQQQQMQQQRMQQQQQMQQQQMQQQQMQQQQVQQQQLQQEQLQHQQSHHQVMISSAFPAGTSPPSQPLTTCADPATELLPNAAPPDATTGREGLYTMDSLMQQQYLRSYAANEHVASVTRRTTEGTAEKNIFPMYQTLYAQQQYRLAQQQRQQLEAQRQRPQEEKEQRASGEAWLSSQSFILKDVPPRVLTDQTVSSQQQIPEKGGAAPFATASGAEKKFTSTVESIFAKSGDDDKKGSASSDRPAGSLMSSQQSECAEPRMETQAQQQQMSRQQSYPTTPDLMEKNTHQQHLQQAYLQQQQGEIAMGYHPPTTRDTSVVTTHIPQRADSPNPVHAATGATYYSDSSTGTSSLAQQQSDPISASMPVAYPSATAVLDVLPASSLRMPQEFDLSTAGGISSTVPIYPGVPPAVAGAYPQFGARTRVKSLSEVPSPQLGAQHIGNYAQVQAQLDKLTQRQIEAYAQQYGLYPTPQAAAAALGGVPLDGVGALGGPASCNDYAQLMSVHRPLPPIPPNYVFTKS